MADCWNALSVRQPYAHLIVAGEKKYEARTWYPAGLGTLLIHASQSFAAGWRDDPVLLAALKRVGVSPDDALDLPRSALIGRVTVNKIVEPLDEKAHDAISLRQRELCCAGGYTLGTCLWRITDPKPLKKPLRCGGKLFLWPVPESLIAKL